MALRRFINRVKRKRSRFERVGRRIVAFYLTRSLITEHEISGCKYSVIFSLSKFWWTVWLLLDENQGIKRISDQRSGFSPGGHPSRVSSKNMASNETGRALPELSLFKWAAYWPFSFRPEVGVKRESGNHGLTGGSEIHPSRIVYRENPSNRTNCPISRRSFGFQGVNSPCVRETAAAASATVE